MHVLLFNGSPHKNGCTFTALSEVAKTLEEAGVSTEIVQIGSTAFRGCVGCGACKKTGAGCAFGKEDGLNEILDKCKTADGFVFGSPVYYASANGTMISFLDRLFYAGGKALTHKPGCSVVSARRAGTTVTLDELNKYFTINEMPLVSSNYWPMVHGNTPDQVRQDEEGLQIMRNLGRNMAWLLQCIEAGKTAGIEAPTAENQYRTNFIR